MLIIRNGCSQMEYSYTEINELELFDFISF